MNGGTLTPLPPQTFPQICDSWLILITQVMPVLRKLCHYAMVEAVELIKLHPVAIPHIHKVFDHLHILRMVGIWGGNHTVTTTEVSLDLQELSDILGDASVENIQYHYFIVETVEPFKLHPEAMSYIHTMFVRLQMLLIGIWGNSHTVTTTDVSQI